MPEWPHEYIVRDRVDQALFEGLVVHIRTHGCQGRFYEKTITYYEEAGLVYWTMGAPLHETTIVNRCRNEDTYERRLAIGDTSVGEPAVRWQFLGWTPGGGSSRPATRLRYRPVAIGPILRLRNI